MAAPEVELPFRMGWVAARKYQTSTPKPTFQTVSSETFIFEFGNSIFGKPFFPGNFLAENFIMVFYHFCIFGRDCFLGASFVVVVATFHECLEWGVLCRWDVSRGGS